MINYDDHLQFAEKVIARSTLNQYQITDLRQLIQRIQQRKNDPNLYLAVIGEFSSGKSTFINALLRDDLLKTSALVTTAAATRLRYGKTLDVKVNFANLPRSIQKKSDSKAIILALFSTIVSFVLFLLKPPIIIVALILILIIPFMFRSIFRQFTLIK